MQQRHYNWTFADFGGSLCDAVEGQQPNKQVLGTRQLLDRIRMPYAAFRRLRTLVRKTDSHENLQKSSYNCRLFGICRGKHQFYSSALAHHKAIHESSFTMCRPQRLEELVCSS
jgi:hypothetical protein